MGTSGAGKTTFLDIVSCKIPLEDINGRISANGKDYKNQDFGNFAKYVMQNDVLF